MTECVINTNLLKSLMELLKCERSFVESVKELEGLDQESFLSQFSIGFLLNLLLKLLLKHIFE